MAIEKELKLIFSFIKNNSKYEIPQITKDLENFRKVVESLDKYMNIKFTVRVDGIKDVVELKNAIVSLNKSLPAVSNNIAKFSNSLKAINSIDSSKAIQLQDTINKLSTVLSKFSIGQIKVDADQLAKVFEKLADTTVKNIAPMRDFENAIGRLSTKVQQSISSIKGLNQVFQLLQSLSSNVASATAGVKTPVFKSKESEIGALVQQYNKLTSTLDRTSVSIEKFNNLKNKNVDAGTSKQTSKDIKDFKSAYDNLGGVFGRLQEEYKLLNSQQDAASQNLAKSLLPALNAAGAQTQKYSDTLGKAEKASVALQNQERKLRDAYNEQFQTLGGVLKRQVEFLTGAGILAAVGTTIRSGFQVAFQTLNQVQTILTVSRSNFLSTAQTAELLADTMDDAARRTGSAVAEIGTVLKELGSAGLSTEQSIAALDSTMNNIIGTNSSVVETTRLVASTYNILGDSVTGTGNQIANFTRINDVFSRATLESSLELDQLVQALKFSLPASKEAGLSLEELTAILGQLADQGLRGGNAGRAVRAVLQQLSKDAPLIAKALDIEIDLSKPLDLLTIIQQYGEQIKGQELTVEQLGTVFERFGLRGADVFLLLAQNTDKLNKKIEDLNQNAAGSAGLAASLKLDSPERQFAIFTENVSRLSREILKPLIEVFISLIKTINSVAEKISLLANNDLAIFGARALTATLAIKSLGGALEFIGGRQIGASILSVATGTGSLAKGAQLASTAFTAVSGVLGKALPIIGLVGAAITAASLAFGLFAGNNKITIREIEKQIEKQSEVIRQSQKLSESYKTLSVDIVKLSKEYENGNITLEEYKNKLNAFSQLGPEVAEIIFRFGENASVAAEKIKELSDAQERLNEIQRKQLIGQQTEKFKAQALEAEELIGTYRKLNSEINNIQQKLELQIKFPDISNVSADSLKEELNAVTEQRKKSFDEVVKLINDIVAYSVTTTDKIASEQARGIATRLKRLIDPSEFTGLGTEANKIKDIVEDLEDKISGFNVKKLSFDIDQLKNNLTNATRGLEGFRNALLFKNETFVPIEEIEELTQKIKDLPEIVKKQQIGQKFINELNFKGLAQEFAERFNEAGLRSFKLDGLKSALNEAIDSDSNKQQIDAISAYVEQVANNQIKGIEKVKQENIKAGKSKIVIEEQYAKAIALTEAGRTKALTVIAALEAIPSRQRDVQLKAAVLQGEQDLINTERVKLYNAALTEASTIRRDIIKQDKFEVRISKEQLRLVQEENKSVEQLIKDLGLTPELQKRIFENLQTEIVARKKVRDSTEKLKKDLFDIKNNLTKATLELRVQQRIGASTIDQENQRRLLLLEELNIIEQRRADDINRDILLAEELKIRKELNEISRNELIAYQQIQGAAFELQNELLEVNSEHSETQKVLSKVKNSYKNILFLQRDIENATKLGGDAEKDILNKRISQVKEFLNIQNAYKEITELQKKEVSNAEKVLDIRLKINKAQQDLTNELSSRAEAPLRKLLENFFQSNDFSTTQAFVRSIGGGYEEIAFYAGDVNAKVDRFIEELRRGNVELKEYPKSIRDLAGVFEGANEEIKELRKQQNDLNQTKFAILEKEFARALDRGGQEGFDRATSVIDQLVSSFQIINEQTGGIDSERSKGNLAIIQALAARLEEINTQKKANPLQGLIDGTALAADEFKALEAVINQAAAAIDRLNAAGSRSTNERIQNLFDQQRAPLEVERRASGGFIPGSGSGDIVPALLEPGEFVIPKAIVQKLGVDYFNKMIEGGQPAQRFALGGAIRKYAEGGSVTAGGFTAGFATSTEDKVMVGQLSILIGATAASNKLLENISTEVTGTGADTVKNLEFLYNLVNNGIEQVQRPILDTLKIELRRLYDMSFESRNLLKVIASAVDENYSKGGFATGGFVPGSGSGDIVPAMLEPGEFVIPKKIVDKYGIQFFEDLRKSQGFKSGGIVGYQRGGPVDDQFTPALLDKTRKESSLAKIPKTEEAINQLTATLEANNLSLELNTKATISNTENFQKIIADAEKTKIPFKNTEAGKSEGIIAGGEAKAKTATPGSVGGNNFVATLETGQKIISEYIKSVKEAGVSTKNFFLQASGQAAERFLNKIENIGKSFEKLFKESIPGLLTFFLEDVVGANAEILENYAETRRNIAKTYNNQRADLIEQLKRNEISYFDFFDKLEDLQKQNKDDEIDAEKEKNLAIQEQLSRNLTAVAGITGEVIANLAETVADVLTGIPAFLNPVIDNLSKAIGGLGAGLGETIGGLAGAAGAIGGFALGAAAQFFSAVIQGFAGLLPVITKILTAPQTEFESFLDSLSKIPEELDKQIGNMSGRIGRIVEVLVGGDVLKKVGESFGAAISAVFPQIATGFVQIIPEALRAVVPLISSVFDALPALMLSVFLSGGGLISAFVNLVQAAGAEFFDFFKDNLPNLIDVFILGMKSVFDPSNFNALADTFALVSEKLSGTLAAAGPQFVSGLVQAAPQLITSLASSIPGIIDSAIGSISSLTTGEDNPFLKIIDGFIRDIIEQAPKFIKKIPELLKGVFSTLLGGAGFLTEINDLIGAVVETIITNLPDVAGTLFEAFLEILPQIVEQATGFIGSLFAKGFGDEFIGLFQELGKSFSSIFDTFGDIFRSLFSVFKDGGLQKAIKTVFSLFSQFGKIFIDLLTPVLSTAISLINELYAAFAQIFEEVVADLIADGTLAELGELLFSLSTVLLQVLEPLTPLVKELMPVLVPLLTALVIVGLIPLIATLGTLILILYTVKFAIEAVNFVAEKLAAVVAFLAPYFEEIRVKIEPLVLILLGLTTSFGNFIIIMYAVSQAIKFFQDNQETISAGFDLFRESIDRFVTGFETLVERFSTAKDTMIQKLADFINGIIDLIPGARETIGNLNIPGFAKGGLVKGPSGRDAVTANVTAGEYIISKEAADKLGISVLDFMNNPRNVDNIKNNSRLSKDSMVNDFLDVYNGVERGRVTPPSPSPGSGSDLNSLNQNTREFYLDNFYDERSGPSTGAGANNTVALESAFVSAINTSGLTGYDVSGGSSSGGLGSGGSQKVEVIVNFNNCNFSSEDAAQKVQDTIVEQFSNDQGELARILRENFEKGKK